MSCTFVTANKFVTKRSISLTRHFNGKTFHENFMLVFYLFIYFNAFIQENCNACDVLIKEWRNGGVRSTDHFWLIWCKKFFF